MITSAVRFHPRALSEYLALRWLANPATAWWGAFRPDRASLSPSIQVRVGTADEIERALRNGLRDVNPHTTGLLLSGGIDSAILARLVPSGMRAYTIRFDSPGAIDESVMAARYAEVSGLRHSVVSVGWRDYLATSDTLAMRKRAPLHPVEVGLFRATQAARIEGITTLIVGNGADSTFGGLDNLLSRDWVFDAFVERYSFVDPARVLRDPVAICGVFEPWRRAEAFDVAGFLKTVHGEGVTQAFVNAIAAGGCAMRAPYEDLVLDGPLDLGRIRAGESKYLLRELFLRLYPGFEVPEKIAFARPMDRWLADWPGPSRPEFRDDVSVAMLTGEQRWLLYALERFLTRVEELYG
jgi:asparagine synthetase B (glutamine-hydrolysing)